MGTNGAESIDGRMGLPPGPRSPGFVHTLNWVRRPLPFLDRCRARYGDVFTIKIIASGNWVLLCDQQDIKRLFTGDTDVLRAGEGNRVLRPVIGFNSTFLKDGAEHLRQRKLLLPPFHGERMQRYGEIMVEATRRDLAQWPVGEPFALWPRMRNITLEVIMRAVFGVTDPERFARMHAVLQRMLDWTGNARTLARLVYRPVEESERNRRFRAVMDPVNEAVFEEIRLRRAEPDLSEREDILSMLLQARYEDGSAIGDEALRDELKTLLVAGHDTTATALSWAFECLLRNEDKLTRLREELQDGSEEYLDAVVKEALRLHPVIPVALRRLAGPMEFGGYTIPPGTMVLPCIHLVQHDESIYPEPHSFRPERFLAQPAGTYTWIPFGGGVRRCVGAPFSQFEIKKVIETIVTEVDLRAAGSRPEKVARRSITLTPKHGTRAVMTGRRRNAAGSGSQSPEPLPTPV
jgi:cytochrome P450